MIIPALLACALVTPQPPKPNWELATIKSVICSNVVIVAVDTDPDLWVGLLGVGTPETVDPLKDTFLIGKPDPDWLRSWLPRGERVWMERRGETASGRPLVFLYRVEDQFCYNSFLVRSGGAFAAKQIEFPEFDEFAGLERTARERGIGLWQGYRVQPPADTCLAPGTAGASDPEPGTVDATKSRHSRDEARGHSPSTQVNHTAPSHGSVGSSVGASTAYRRRRSYVRQDWSRLDAAMGGMLNQALSSGFGVGGSGGSHLCGHPTRDGTPCMRRVKDENGQCCYQHGG